MEKTVEIVSINDAIKKIKEFSKERFDATIEVHINLDIDAKRADQMIRYTTSLPHGTGKTLKVATMSVNKVEGSDLELKEDDIEKIIKNQLRAKVDFDVLIVEPSFMPKLAKAAKILGPVGLMPNPKNGTVTDNVSKAVEETKKGKIEIKNEKDFPLIHTVIGKVSFEDKALIENFEALMGSLKSNKPAKAKPEYISEVFLVSTMGKSYQIDLSQK